MTLYEELGLAVSAAPEEIRKAHRTLSRLLHPDQQMDDSLRQAAELQMRRLNIIIDILLDPQKRRRYDESLRTAPAEIFPAPTAVPRIVVRSSFSLLDVVGIILAAILITILVIWLFGGDFIRLRELSSELNAPAGTAAAGIHGESVKHPQKAVQQTVVPVKKRFEPPPEAPATRTQTLPAPTPLGPPPQHKVAPQILAYQPETLTLSASTYPPASLRLPPAPVPEVAVPPDKVTPPALPFTGLWLLPSSGRKGSGSGSVQQAPQYIQVNIILGQEDTVYGEYSARYEAPDRPISPEVAFTFDGPVAGNAAAFVWKAADGSRGAVELKLLNPRSMQVTWRVIEFGSTIGIAGGAAVVIRKE